MEYPYGSAIKKCRYFITDGSNNSKCMSDGLFKSMCVLCYIKLEEGSWERRQTSQGRWGRGNRLCVKGKGETLGQKVNQFGWGNQVQERSVGSEWLRTRLMIESHEEIVSKTCTLTSEIKQITNFKCGHTRTHTYRTALYLWNPQSLTI